MHRFAPAGARPGRRPGRRSGALALLLPLVALTACREPPAATAPLAGRNLVLIAIDALRADHLGAYGYTRRPTSPFIDRLAREGVVFERALATSSFTRESVAALFTGRWPSRGGGAGWQAAPPPATRTLAEHLAAAGYATALLSNTTMLELPGFARGFQTEHHLPARWDLSGEGPRLSDAALAQVRAQGDRPFALYLHYLDPHAPYAPAPRFLARFGETPAPHPLALYTDVIPHLAALRADGFGPGDARFEDLLLRYDAEIAATDAAIERLFRGLDRLGVLDDTLVVLTADHGEEFLEHGYLEHGWTLYQEALHVPLVLWAPGVLAPARVPGTVTHVDLLPTVLALLGLPGDPDLPGRALVRPTRHGPRPAPATHPQLVETLLPQRNMLRSLVDGDWKLVVAEHWRGPERRADRLEPVSVDPRRAFVREELYDLGLDPEEHRDVAREHPRRLARMRARLEAHRAAGGTPRPGTAIAVSEQDAARLRALGYH